MTTQAVNVHSCYRIPFLEEKLKFMMCTVSSCLLILGDLSFLNYSEVEILVEWKTVIHPVVHPIHEAPTEPCSKLNLLPEFTRMSRAVIVQGLDSFRSVREDQIPFFHK